MSRCAFVAPDGRKCLLPEPHPRKHLVSPAQFTVDAATRVAEGWGFMGSAANAVVRGAFSNGPVSPEKFVAMLTAAAAAGLNRRKS